MVPWFDYIDVDLTHIITLDNGIDKPYTETILPPEVTAYFSVTPGLWNISVEAYEINEDGKEIYWYLIAVGYESVDIKPGHNGTVPIQMCPPPQNQYDELQVRAIRAF